MDIFFIIALLFGIFLKLFDDIIDNSLFRSIFGSYDKISEEIFKTFIITLNTILILKEPFFGLSFVVCSIAMILGDMFFYKEKNYEHKGMDHDFWWSYSIITFLITGFSFFVKENIETNIPIFLLLTFFIFGIFLIEPYFIPENNSKNKTYSRSIIVILYSIFLYFKDDISILLASNIDYITYLIGGTTSYFALSIIINTIYPINNDETQCVSIIENNLEE
jgi:hypothetical protein